MRGLKRITEADFLELKVASFTDAWIETCFPTWSLQVGGSRIFYRCVDWNVFSDETRDTYGVASFTDAWIETEGKSLDTVFGYVASFTDAWIET